MTEHNRPLLPLWFLLFAPLPAVILGVWAMKQAGVPSGAWVTNIAAAVVGTLLVIVSRRLPRAQRHLTQVTIAAAAITTILLPFVSKGLLGVHRWVRVGGISLQPSAIVAPLLIICVAAIAQWNAIGAIAMAVLTTIVLALQPDAAQAVSFAAACIALFVFHSEWSRGRVIASVALLLAAAAISFTQRDPLAPVAHVEGIYALVASHGMVWAVLGAFALILLPLPFAAQFARSRDRVALALTTYVAMTVLAPWWGTFPVPVMGYGVSHMLGYFIALAACGRK